MFKLDHSKVARLLAITVMACAVGGSSVALAKATRPGSSPPVKNPGMHQPVHGPGSTHNPVIAHGPLHGPGSTHNPIIAHGPLHGPGSTHNPHTSAGPGAGMSNASRVPATWTLARRCDPPPCPARLR